MGTMSPRSKGSRWIAAALTVIAVLALGVTAYATVDRTGALSVDTDLAAVANATMDVADTAAVKDVELPLVQTDPEVPAPTTEPLSMEDGFIVEGETLSPFDTDRPAVAGLDSELLTAVQRAAMDARDEGLELEITSGWRSTRYQQTLLDEAIATYGSEAEARKWVNTADRSTHVTGHAVDIGPTDAADWLGRHGRDYGLCQVYANEIWHFELLATPGGDCPALLEDASTS